MFLCCFFFSMDNGQDKEQSLDDLFPLDDSANLANDITIPNINIHTSNMVDDGNLDIGELHNDLSNEIVFTVWNNSKSGKTVVDSVKSSPCSPTISFLNETELAMPSQRQRSYSASMDKLNPQELAFLEELEIFTHLITKLLHITKWCRYNVLLILFVHQSFQSKQKWSYSI